MYMVMVLEGVHQQLLNSCQVAMCEISVGNFITHMNSKAIHRSNLSMDFCPWEIYDLYVHNLQTIHIIMQLRVPLPFPEHTKFTDKHWTFWALLITAHQWLWTIIIMLLASTLLYLAFVAVPPYTIYNAYADTSPQFDCLYRYKLVWNLIWI